MSESLDTKCIASVAVGLTALGVLGYGVYKTLAGRGCASQSGDRSEPVRVAITGAAG